MLFSPAKLGSPRAQKNLLRLVALFELVKGLLVLCIGVAALLLVHKDAWLMAESVLALLHISTEQRSAQIFLDFADRLTDARLWAAARIAFAYTALRFAEAYGLWHQRTWAEWVAFVSGTLLLPVEIHGLMRGVTAWRVGLLAGNIAIVLYMLFLLLKERRERHAMAAESHGPSGN